MTTPELPSYLRDRPYQPRTDQLAGSLGQGAPPYVSIAGGRFTLIDAAGTEQPLSTIENGIPYMDCVVVDSLERISKIYYDHAYDPSGNFGPPTCWSDNGIAPSRNAGSPQSPTCASCEKGAWGSAVSRVDPTRKVKACADYQKLALFVAGFEGIYLLRVPPNSLKAMREYNARFKGSGTDISDVITRISFEKDVLGTLTFRGVSFIDQNIAGKRNEILLKKGTDGLVGRLDQPIAGAVAAQIEHREEQPRLGGPGLNVGFQPTPMAPPATPTVAQPLPAQSAPPQAGAPSNGRRRGRPRAQPAQEGVIPAQQASQAPFPTPSNPAPSQPAAGQFGIAQGQAPGAELNAALDNFFGPAPQR